MHQRARGYLPFMIINTTRKTTIASNVRVLRSSFEQARGLMFRSLDLDTAYAFPYSWRRRETIIMPFVRQPLDLIFLDAGRVVEFKEGLMPWKTYPATKMAGMLIEAHRGTIARSRTRIGDRVVIHTGSPRKDI